MTRQRGRGDAAPEYSGRLHGIAPYPAPGRPESPAAGGGSGPLAWSVLAAVALTTVAVLGVLLIAVGASIAG